MSLINLAKENSEAIQSYTVEQIVAICGDGKLRDQSVCSNEFRDFLTSIDNDKLAEYAKYCLETKFEKGGLVLQDTMNEIGRRLGYEVENGRYIGTKNAVGFDGIWFDGENHIVVEVKTTDAYRINLDTIVNYGKKIETGSEEEERKLKASLIIVGREDTGDLEAQIRGSRHAWSIRLVSVDALLKLMFVNESLDEKALTDKIKTILMPFEYTRVDNIVDLVFETQQETDLKAQTIDELSDEKTEIHGKRKMVFTPSFQLDEKRLEIVNSFFSMNKKQFFRVSKTNFSDQQKILHATCAISKRYKRDYAPYWYALHPKWVEFMGQENKGYFILGCMDRDVAFAIPYRIVKDNLKNLNKTEEGERHYWHISLNLEGEKLYWNLSKIGEKLNLESFSFKIHSS